MHRVVTLSCCVVLSSLGGYQPAVFCNSSRARRARVYFLLPPPARFPPAFCVRAPSVKSKMADTSTTTDIEVILTTLQLGCLIESFKQERIDCHAVVSATDSELQRLGVATIGDRVRLRESCKKKVNGSSSGSLVNRIQQECNLLFRPSVSSSPNSRNNGSTSSGGTRRNKSVQKRPWTVQFVCLADRLCYKVPNAVEKQTLHNAGLGLKKIKLDLEDDEEEVLKKIT